MFRLTIIDKYILKRYLLTFFGILFLFVPIGILASLAEKVNKILESKATAEEIWMYYGNFTLVLGNMLMPRACRTVLVLPEIQTHAPRDHRGSSL